MIVATIAISLEMGLLANGEVTVGQVDSHATTGRLGRFSRCSLRVRKKGVSNLVKE